MKSSMKFERVYSDEHMVEIHVSICKPDISANISCYTQTDSLHELSVQCKSFISSKTPFEWSIGTSEYALFSLYVKPYDSLGHVEMSVTMLNNKDDLNVLKCEFIILLDLGLVEDLGNKIINLIDDDYVSFVINQD